MPVLRYYDSTSGTWLPAIVGAQGPQGAPVSVTIGTTTTTAAGQPASVTNSGTSSASILNFSIPTGTQGPQGLTGPQGTTGYQGLQGTQGSYGINVDAGSPTTVSGGTVGIDGGTF